MQSLFHRRMRHAAFGFVIPLVTSFLVVANIAPEQVSAQRFGASQTTLSITKGSKLSSRLDAVANVSPAIQGNEASNLQETDPTAPGSMVWDETGAVLAYIRVTDTSEPAFAALAAAGARVIHINPQYNIVTAYVQPDDLSGLAALALVENIQEAQRPDIDGAGLRSAAPNIPQATSCAARVISEGDVQLNAAAARTAFAIDGSGVTIGALSDSYDTAENAATNAATDIASGELPGPGNPCGYTAPVTVLADSSSASATDEGRAMLQIIHDLAPGADLAFATANGGMFAFADNIRKVRAAGAQIIVDDVSYLQEPFYQDGPVSVAIEEVTSRGAMYVKAVGNSHAYDKAGNPIGSYEASYRPAPCPTTLGTHQYEDCQAFHAASGDTTMGITLEAGGKFILVLQWAQPWYGVETDLDIFLTDGSGTMLARSTNTNPGKNGTQMPYETLTYTNSSKTSQQLSLAIARHSGPAVRALKYVLVRSSGITATEYNSTNSLDTFGATVIGHATSAAALSVGAIPYTSKYHVEPFSARGAATLYFSAVSGTTASAPLPTPEVRYKPDLLATDGVRTSFFGTLVNGFHRFYGTSAAAPHAAAVAALMRELASKSNVQFDHQNAASLLKSTSAKVALSGDQEIAVGLIDALKAAEGIAPAEVFMAKIYLPRVVK